MSVDQTVAVNQTVNHSVITQALSRAFCELHLDPRDAPYIGLYNSPPFTREHRREFKLELRNAVTGARIPLGIFPWVECEAVVGTALAALAAERRL